MMNSLVSNRGFVIPGRIALFTSVLALAACEGQLGNLDGTSPTTGSGSGSGSGSSGSGGYRPPVGGGSKPLPAAASCAPASSGSSDVAEPQLFLQLSDDDESAWLGSPVVADLDGDGEQEILVTHNGNVVVWGPDGEQKWRYTESRQNGRIWASPIVADFRGDGQLEVVFAARTTIYMLDASGRLVSGWPVTWNDEIRSLAAGDIDGDGQLDVVAASTGRSDYSDILMAFHASGSAVAGFPPIESQTIGCDARRSDDAECWIVGGYDQNLAIGDLDGDGSQDIVSPMDNSYAGFYHGTGEAFDANPMFEGRPKTPGVRYMHDLELAKQGFGDSSDLQAYFKNSAPAIADLDGDGTPEIVMLAAAEDVAMNDQSQGVGLWAVRNDASRIEGWESPFYASDYLSGGEDFDGNIVAMTQQVTVADLDATRAGPEMIFAGLDGRIHAVYADKTEFWDVTYTDDTQVLTGGVVVGDLSGDGIPEIVFNTYSTDENRSHLFVLDAGGTILHKIPLPRLGAMPVPTLADVNGDGTIEIVVSLREIGWNGADPEPNTYVYTVPGSATNCLLWPTARGNYYRNGWVRAAD
ncbi:FG-GAP repeat domain-containing protein [Sorangium sp. So ce204]|uniref:FG-GAP repeat domain-containing protein n=1 Tax=Sorangium sp. So ce204 TaxID=3133288 RepID=UPI003F60C753